MPHTHPRNPHSGFVQAGGVRQPQGPLGSGRLAFALARAGFVAN